jgi:pyruvate-ferredoxin/flavodoxin oxidoreductase
MQNQKAAVDSGQWLLYRYNPDLEEQGLNPLVLDSRGPKIPVEQYMYMENRFKMLTKTRPEKAGELLKEAQEDVNTRWRLYEYLAARSTSGDGVDGSEATDNGHNLTPGASKAAVLRDHVLLPSRPLRMPDGRIARGVETSK